MSNSQLPERPSLEFLRKQAKEQLKLLRQSDPLATLAGAQLAVARDHGFSSWRALKAEVERRHSNHLDHFFTECASGNADSVRTFLERDPTLVRAANPKAPYGGWTGLHAAAQRGSLEIVRVLLEHGADPNAREAGDNSYPLHWAAAGGQHLEVARALLEARGDVNGFGDEHALDVIGWAAIYESPDRDYSRKQRMIALLLEWGARHHIFSAIALGDRDAVQTLVEENPTAIDRRLSRFEQSQSPLHFTISRNRHDLLDLLIQLGADLDATDVNGHTALDLAMLKNDSEAMRLLKAAGAEPSTRVGTSDFRRAVAKMADSTRKIVPMIAVPNIAQALDWYAALGFKEVGRYADGGVVNWGLVSFGKAELMFSIGEPVRTSLWLYTNAVDEAYEAMKSGQLQAAQAVLAGQATSGLTIEFMEHLYSPFYGGRQFSIKDLNGYALIFYAE